MAARGRLLAVALLGMFLSACAVQTIPQTSTIALIAPFEGRYREIGYQALYAARLAISETAPDTVELLALDDGGTVATALQRATALEDVPNLQYVLLVGPNAVEDPVRDAIPEEVTAHVVGSWKSDILTTDGLCDDICQLEVFRTLNPDLANIIIETTSPPVTNAFRERYESFDQFVPAPLPIARHTYEITAGWLTSQPISSGPTYRYRYQNNSLQLTTDTTP